MGAAASLAKKSKKRQHNNCNCTLYDTHGHCCKNECLSIPYVRPDDQRKALSQALKQYRAQYIIDWILQYLPDSRYEIIQYNTRANGDNPQYRCLIHPPLISNLDANKPPCAIWLNSKWHGPEQIHIRVMVLGAGGVGKSALTLRFVTGQFFNDYDPTIEDSYRKPISVNGVDREVWLDVVDIAGQLDFDFVPLRSRFTRNYHFVLILFAVNLKSSLQVAGQLRAAELRLHEAENRPMILVATKCDLRDNDAMVDNCDAGRELARKWNVAYIETSAKDDKNVDFLFLNLIVRELWIQSQVDCVSRE